MLTIVQEGGANMRKVIAILIAAITIVSPIVISIPLIMENAVVGSILLFIFYAFYIGFPIAIFHEVVSLYRNPLPRFNEHQEKRFSKLLLYKTRSILKDRG